MLNRKPRIGQEIGSYCGKCKDERTHIVAAMEGEKVVKVTCSMCGSNHNYRKNPADNARADSNSPARSRTSRRVKSTRGFYIDPSQPVKDYDMSSLFRVGDVISHSKFGKGVVKISESHNKIEVEFQDGVRKLMHNMKNND